MTDTAPQAEWRWTLAEHQARLVLRHPAPRRPSLPVVAVVLAVAVVALVGTALASAPDSTGRWVSAIVGTSVGVVLVFVDVVRAVRARSRHPDLTPVTKHLTPRERSAVQRVIRGRVQAPADRVDVVRASAMQTAGGLTIPAAAGQLLVFTGIAVSGVTFWPLYAVVATLWAVPVVVALRDVALARRYLDRAPV